MSNSTYLEIFGAEGKLSKNIPHFKSRPQQLHMAEAVDEAITHKQWLIAEAATGTGKTFAYLVPSLLSGKKVLIATATKALQDQLVLQDLPRIISALGIARTVQNLKGRDNYLCKYHITRILSESQARSLPYYSDLIKIYEQLPQLVVGEKSEIRHIPPDAVFWNGLTAHTDNCLAAKCPMQSECFMYQARKKAMEADCVVVNHHLFFADSRLKSDGFGALLPVFEIFIFDEAHQLLDIASQFYSQAFTSSQMMRLLSELDTASGVHQKGIKKQSIALHDSVEKFLLDTQGIVQSVEIKTMLAQKTLPLSDWIEGFKALFDSVEALEGDSERWAQRLKSLLETMQQCAQTQPTGVAWLQPLKRHIRFQWSPFDVAKQVEALLNDLSATLVFTSATLRTNQHFEWFQQALGLTRAKTVFWDSPYDWEKQAMLYIPHDLPDVYDESYYSKFIDHVLPVIEQLGGRTFILFTSHRALQWVATELPKRCTYPILVQGSEDKAMLLASFRQLGNAVLLGTGSFWEGVDVRGEALSCVAIDKLPFANIGEPLVAAKLRYLKSQGKSAFDDYLIPGAILSLKQGIGRLLRTEKDQGVVIIGDPRLIGRPYGGLIRNSLPPMYWTRSLPKLKNFIASFSGKVGGA